MICSFENITFRRKLIIGFDNMICSFKNMPKRHQNGMDSLLLTALGGNKLKGRPNSWVLGGEGGRRLFYRFQTVSEYSASTNLKCVGRNQNTEDMKSN